MNAKRLTRESVQRLISEYRYLQSVRRQALVEMAALAAVLPSGGRAFGVTEDIYVLAAGYRRVLDIQKLSSLVTAAQLESCMVRRYRKATVKVVSKAKPRSKADKEQAYNAENPRYRIKKRKTTMQAIALEYL